VLHIYFGHEDRLPAGTTVFVHSVLAHARDPLALIPLARGIGEPTPEGSNAFTLRRFLAPYYQQWRGWAVFVDGADMLCRTDLGQMLDEADPYLAVQVVKHNYQTRHARKYRGSPMEADNPDYPRKNWASVMVINCAHYAWRLITPEHLTRANPMDLLQLKFIPDDRIGELDPRWNWLADEQGVNPDARILHWTAGIPGIPAYRGSPHADEWFAAHAAAAA
jgi:hypothetical protein